MLENINNTIKNNFNTLAVDSILRDKNQNRVLYTSQLNEDNTIKYITPNNNKDLISTICIYKNKLTKTLFIDEFNENWSKIDENESIMITHDLNAEVNIILRDNENKLMFKYSDYILNENQILIVFPDNKDIVKSFTIDIYPIYQ